MSTYVVGDIQGCYEPLVELLDQVAFCSERDVLMSVGDVINRGPKNLEVVRLVRSLGDSFRAVLGNHDLSFLAVALGARQPKRSDTTADLLAAPEREELVQWFRERPLAMMVGSYLVVHAGVAPDWDVEQTLQYAAEVSAVLRSDCGTEYLEHMYGDTPHRFDESLKGYERLRVITNVLTRIRFCSSSGVLDLRNKLGPEHAPEGMRPWYEHPERKTRDQAIVFGHWAALDGRAAFDNVYALDTGCVWGKHLTCLRLEDRKRFSCPCPKKLG